MKKSNIFKKIIAAAIIISATFLSGCKKEKIQTNIDAQIAGVWSHTSFISPSSSILTQLEFRADGTGSESVFRISTFNSSDPTVTDFKWTSENNNILKQEFEDGTVEESTYSLLPVENKLTITSASGNILEFFKTE